MALYTLESLVLRGVSVLCDGKALNLRLGTSVEPVVPISAVDNSMYPLSDARPDNAQPVGGHNHQVPNQVEKPAIEGAGRSHSVGAQRRLTAATRARWAASPFEAPAAGFFAGGQEKRVEERSAWRQPARRTPPQTTRGTRSR
jgi:hypothetical protein